MPKQLFAQWSYSGIWRVLGVQQCQRSFSLRALSPLSSLFCSQVSTSYFCYLQTTQKPYMKTPSNSSPQVTLDPHNWHPKNVRSGTFSIERSHILHFHIHLLISCQIQQCQTLHGTKTSASFSKGKKSRWPFPIRSTFSTPGFTGFTVGCGEKYLNQGCEGCINSSTYFSFQNPPVKSGKLMKINGISPRLYKQAGNFPLKQG